MVRQVGSSVSDVDLAVLVTDASEPWEKLTRAEMDLIEQFKKLDLPAVAVLNKIDLLKDKEQLIPMMAVLNEAYDFQQIVPPKRQDRRRGGAPAEAAARGRH